MPKPIRYKVRNRYGFYRGFTNRREAERYASDERRDGWPAHVHIMGTPDDWCPVCGAGLALDGSNASQTEGGNGNY